MIDNFFQQNYHSFDEVYVSPQTGHRIFLGDAQSAMDSDFHMKSKIRTVVTAAKNMEHIIVGEGITHITYPLLDGKNQNITAFFERFYELVEGNIKKGNMLVHCAAGISRSATLMISYLMRKERLSFKDAISFVRKSRPNVLPNLGFERQLKRYQQKLRLGMKNSRSSRRSQVRTSESGKSDGSIKSQILPLVAPFPNVLLPRQEGEGGMLRFIDKFSQKDIQILKIYNNGRKNVLRNRLLQNKGKNRLNTLPDKRVMQGEVFEEREDPFFRIFKMQNNREIKSRRAIEDLACVHEQKKTDPFLKKQPSERGQTTDHLKKR